MSCRTLSSCNLNTSVAVISVLLMFFYLFYHPDRPPNVVVHAWTTLDLYLVVNHTRPHLLLFNNMYVSAITMINHICNYYIYIDMHLAVPLMYDVTIVYVQTFGIKSHTRIQKYITGTVPFRCNVTHAWSISMCAD